MFQRLFEKESTQNNSLAKIWRCGKCGLFGASLVVALCGVADDECMCVGGYKLVSVFFLVARDDLFVMLFLVFSSSCLFCTICVLIVVTFVGARSKTGFFFFVTTREPLRSGTLRFSYFPFFYFAEEFPREVQFQTTFVLFLTKKKKRRLAMTVGRSYHAQGD